MPGLTFGELAVLRCAREPSLTLKKLECLKQAFCLDTSAWDNMIGLWFYFVGLRAKVMINRASWGH